MYFSREKKFCKNIIIINGHSNSGKSLIAPILSSLNKIEMWCFNHIYEYICVLHHFKKIDYDAAETILRLYSDYDLYNTIIGRNVNWRTKDLSSVQYNLKENEYKEKYKYNADDLINNINNSELILPIMTHYIFGFSRILFESFEDKLLMFINTVRNPIWTMNYWYEENFFERNLNDPTDFELCLKDGNKFLPYFLIENGVNVNDLSKLETAIFIFKIFKENEDNMNSNLADSFKEKVFTLYFEKFIFEPEYYLEEICKYIKTSETSLTTKILAKMGLPRNLNKGYYRNNNGEIIHYNNNKGYYEQTVDDFFKIMNTENVDHSLKKYVHNLICDYDVKLK